MKKEGKSDDILKVGIISLLHFIVSRAAWLNKQQQNNNTTTSRHWYRTAHRFRPRRRSRRRSTSRRNRKSSVWLVMQNVDSIIDWRYWDCRHILTVRVMKPNARLICKTLFMKNDTRLCGLREVCSTILIDSIEADTTQISFQSPTG